MKTASQTCSAWTEDAKQRCGGEIMHPYRPSLQGAHTVYDFNCADCCRSSLTAQGCWNDFPNMPLHSSLAGVYVGSVLNNVSGQSLFLRHFIYVSWQRLNWCGTLWQTHIIQLENPFKQFSHCTSLLSGTKRQSQNLKPTVADYRLASHYLHSYYGI